jgi:hypothetical protein
VSRDGWELRAKHEPPPPAPERRFLIATHAQDKAAPALREGPKKKRAARKRVDTSDIGCLLEIGELLQHPPIPGDVRPPSVHLARVLLRVRDRFGLERPLAANPAQLAFEQARATGNIVLKARQMGITTWVAGRFFLKTITARGVLTVMVAHTRDSAQAIFKIVQRFWEGLDEELREGALRRSVANVGCMRFPALDSEFRVLSAADPNAGRGLTMQNLHCSEVARWPGNASETLAGLRAALPPGGELVLESTPNGAYGCFYEEWLKALDPQPNRVPHISPLRCGTEPPQEPGQKSTQTALTRHFFPWWLEPAYADAPVTDPTPEETDLIARHNLTPEQIGFRRILEASYQRLRSQEYAEDPETCFRATGDCCFNIESIENRIAELTPPPETRRGGTLHLWLTPQPGKSYILGVDSAGGGMDGDFAAIQVIDLETGLQCAELQERLKTIDLAQAAADLAREYNHAVIAVERNNHGAGVLANLAAIHHDANLYQHAGEPGWPTNTATKPQMVALMGSLLAESPQLFLSRRFLAECRTFVAFTNGRTGAANGSHDDCFMAMAVAQSVRREILHGS